MNVGKLMYIFCFVPLLHHNIWSSQGLASQHTTSPGVCGGEERVDMQGKLDKSAAICSLNELYALFADELQD
eukprot:752068-Amphidinium_carterae.1